MIAIGMCRTGWWLLPLKPTIANVEAAIGEDQHARFEAPCELLGEFNFRRRAQGHHRVQKGMLSALRQGHQACLRENKLFALADRRAARELLIHHAVRQIQDCAVD